MSTTPTDVMAPSPVIVEHLKKMGETLQLQQLSLKEMSRLQENKLIGCDIQRIHEPGAKYFVALCQNGIKRTVVFQFISEATKAYPQPTIETIAFDPGDSYEKFLEASTRGLL